MLPLKSLPARNERTHGGMEARTLCFNFLLFMQRVRCNCPVICTFDNGKYNTNIYGVGAGRSYVGAYPRTQAALLPLIRCAARNEWRHGCMEVVTRCATYRPVPIGQDAIVLRCRGFSVDAFLSSHSSVHFSVHNSNLSLRSMSRSGDWFGRWRRWMDSPAGRRVGRLSSDRGGGRRHGHFC